MLPAGSDEQASIGHDRRHPIGQGAFLSMDRNCTVNVGKYRIEQVSNLRKASRCYRELRRLRQGHKKVAKVNRVVAPYQAYINAAVVLEDYRTFPYSQGCEEETPEGHEKRRP